MSYPPARYLGESGESTRGAPAAVQEPDLVMSPGGTQVHYLSTGASTNGAFGLSPVGDGPEARGRARTSTGDDRVLLRPVRQRPALQRRHVDGRDAG